MRAHSLGCMGCCNFLNLPEAGCLRVAQQHSPNHVGNVALPLLARKLEPVGVVRVDLQGDISGRSGGFHALVVLQATLHPFIVKPLRRFIEDQLEADTFATVFPRDLHEAGCTQALLPKALAAFADPSTTGHTTLLHLQLPRADAAQNQATISLAPKSMGKFVAATLATDNWGQASLPWATGGAPPAPFSSASRRNLSVSAVLKPSLW